MKLLKVKHSFGVHCIYIFEELKTKRNSSLYIKSLFCNFTTSLNTIEEKTKRKPLTQEL